jgi:hypothetical protein
MMLFIRVALAKHDNPKRAELFDQLLEANIHIGIGIENFVQSNSTKVVFRLRIPNGQSLHIERIFLSNQI